MHQMLRLAIRDLLQNRLQLLCDTALLIGVLVPLMVLLGAKTGVQQAMLADLYADPGILEINTRGNSAMGFAERDTVLSWPETGFVALKTRAYTDFVRVRNAGGGRIETARLVATEPGDPLLAGRPALAPGTLAISAGLADSLGLDAGGAMDLVSDSQDRARQLRIRRDVAVIADAARVPDPVIFADYDTLQLFEAYYEGYALPDHGVAEGRDLAQRVEDFEGMRLYATDLAAVPDLAARVETTLGVQTRSNATRIAATLRLGDNLNLAFRIIAAVAVVGLGAALLSSFWAAVDRKRRTLATLALLGVPRTRLALFPLIQAGGLAVVGLVLSFALFGGAALVAEALFSGRLDGGARVIALTPGDVAGLVLGTAVLVLLAALISGRRILRIDPAIILREAT
ncbi:MAG: ABC transporter permease [Marinibacterium sp.]|nr:ABC transporter permease [Marinibacterium sp.]